MQYDFFSPRQIVFGWGRRREVGKLAAGLGQRALVVSGSRRLAADGVLNDLAAALQAAGVESVHLASISHEPLVEDVAQGLAAMADVGSRSGDFVLAIGGGSALDLGKALAALATQPRPLAVGDYLEGVGRGLTLDAPPLLVLAMPTTAGTGSEATKNAVISSYDPPFKKSLRSDRMVPAAVLIDPELTVSVPPEVTAHTGMDAITQLIESYISCRARPIPSALARDGLRLALPAIAVAVTDGGNRPAREAMAQAAMLSGLALANSGLGLAHGVAAALGVHARVPHGLACAVMLPAALRANREISRRQLAELARAALPTRDVFPVSIDETIAADTLIEHVETLWRQVGIPKSLSELGVTQQQLPALAAASKGNSLSGNPRPIEQAELLAILTGLL